MTLYARRFLDRNITKDSGIYDLLEPGDTIMADRGFTLKDDLPISYPTLISRHFWESQYSLSSENETRQIASARVHVERATERVKNFKILQSTFPLSMAPELNKIWVMCSYLVNFLP